MQCCEQRTSAYTRAKTLSLFHLIIISDCKKRMGTINPNDRMAEKYNCQHTHRGQCNYSITSQILIQISINYCDYARILTSFFRLATPETKEKLINPPATH
jgi:hypothetical protein